MSRLLVRVPLILLAATLCLLTDADPAQAACEESVNWSNASETCEVAGGGTLPAGTTDSSEYILHPVCGVRVNGVCGSTVPCTTLSGEPGTYHSVTIDGQDGGLWCIGESEANDAGVVTPGQVLRAMRNLDWPESTLVIQPPDGLTLVNFDTNFYTTSTRPVIRQVTLLGQQITIEATPAEYLWEFGDGRSMATAKPGAAYPDLTITHNYEDAGTYQPQLSTVYSGRFRVGAGPWQQIPGTHTVSGTPQALRAIEAQPKLVGY